MQAAASRLELMGMLWYHGVMQQREAESTLEACSEELHLSTTYYLVREHRGGLYLSTKLGGGGMCYHIAVHRMSSPKGYCLDGHHNVFQSLGELVQHHIQNPVYVDGGDFHLQTCCHKEYVAYALRYIGDFKGPCIIQVRQDSIVIKNSNGAALGVWPYCVIREFKFDDVEKTFVFTSGRRGPFGVENYSFDLHDRIYYSIRETVNRIAKGGEGPDISPHRSSCRNPPKKSEGSALRHVGGGSVGTGVSRMRDRPVHSGEVSNDQYVRVLSRDYNELPPPVPPHANNKRRVSHAVPLMHSSAQRSSSIPDLRDKVFRTDSTNSEKSSPIRVKNFRGSVASSSSSTGGDTSMCDSDDSSSFDYQVPTNPNTSDYQVPRSQDDARNDYQIPRPVEQTYMAPRNVSEDRVKDIEHSYEDPDLMFGDKMNTIKIMRQL